MVPRERFSHAACQVNTSLLIVGGLNLDNFLPADLYTLELDPYHAKRIRADENMRRNDNFKGGLGFKKPSSMPMSALSDD